MANLLLVNSRYQQIPGLADWSIADLPGLVISDYFHTLRSLVAPHTEGPADIYMYIYIYIYVYVCMYCHERGPFSTFSRFEHPSHIPRTGFHISPQRYFKLSVQFGRCPGRRPVETSSALKQRACAQNVSDDIQDLHFVMLVYTRMRGQVLSSIVSAHRSGRTLVLVFTL